MSNTEVGGDVSRRHRSSTSSSTPGNSGRGLVGSLRDMVVGSVVTPEPHGDDDATSVDRLDFCPDIATPDRACMPNNLQDPIDSAAMEDWVSRQRMSSEEPSSGNNLRHFQSGTASDNLLSQSQSRTSISDPRSPFESMLRRPKELSPLSRPSTDIESNASNAGNSAYRHSIDIPHDFLPGISVDPLLRARSAQLTPGELGSPRNRPPLILASPSRKECRASEGMAYVKCQSSEALPHLDNVPVLRQGLKRDSRTKHSSAFGNLGAPSNESNAGEGNKPIGDVTIYNVANMLSTPRKSLLLRRQTQPIMPFPEIGPPSVALTSQLQAMASIRGRRSSPRKSNTSLHDGLASALTVSGPLPMRTACNRSISMTGINRMSTGLSGQLRRQTMQNPFLDRAATMPQKRRSMQSFGKSRFAVLPDQSPHLPTQPLSKIARQTVHYLSLVLAEHPIEKHRQFQQLQQQEACEVQEARFRSSTSAAATPAESELEQEWGVSHLSAMLQSYQSNGDIDGSAGQSDQGATTHINGPMSTSSPCIFVGTAGPQAAKREPWSRRNTLQGPPSIHEHSSEFFAEEELTLAKLRWQNAIQTIVRSRDLVYHSEILSDRNLPGKDRFCAVVQLECMLANYSASLKRRVVKVLTSEARRRRMSHAEMLRQEITVTGERILEFFTPATMHNHRLYFSFMYIVTVSTLFFFMAGEYSHHITAKHICTNDMPTFKDTICEEHDDGVRIVDYGPRGLLSWILSVWNPSEDKVFDSEYLHLWGSRYNPDLANGEFYRWFSSVLIHRSFEHLFANAVLTLCMSLHLEAKYGFWRIALVWLMSCFGGQMLSATMEDPCSHVVGASGGVYGMIGLFIADMVVNFETIKRPLMRCLVLFGIITVFVSKLAIQNTDGVAVSHLSHVGGLMCGLFLSFLFLPKLRRGRHHIVLSLFGLVVFLAYFFILPLFLYLHRFPNIVCVGH